MNGMKKYTTLAMVLAVLVPWYSPAAQEESINIEIERIIEEAKEGDGKTMVIVRKEERIVKAPEPLGMNLTLEFTIEGAGETFSVTTATTAFMLSSQHSTSISEQRTVDEDEWNEAHSVSESNVNAKGTVQVLENGALLIRCGGAFLHDSQEDEKNGDANEHSSSSAILNFDASVMIRPGGNKTLASHGNLRLVLHVATDET